MHSLCYRPSVRHLTVCQKAIDCVTLSRLPERRTQQTAMRSLALNSIRSRHQALAMRGRHCHPPSCSLEGKKNCRGSVPSRPFRHKWDECVPQRKQEALGIISALTRGSEESPSALWSTLISDLSCWRISQERTDRLWKKCFTSFKSVRMSNRSLISLL